MAGQGVADLLNVAPVHWPIASLGVTGYGREEDRSAAGFDGHLFVRTRTERETHSAQLLPFMEDRAGRREGAAGAANEFTYGTVEAYACEGERG
jgi:hypothetical protein